MQELHAKLDQQHKKGMSMESALCEMRLKHDSVQTECNQCKAQLRAAQRHIQ